MKRTAIVTAAVTTATAGALVMGTATSFAQPANTGPATYTTSASTDGTGLRTVLHNATFAAAPKGSVLPILDSRGRQVASIPLTVNLYGQSIPLRQNVSAKRTSVTLVPAPSLQQRAIVTAAANRHPASARKDRAYQRMIYHLNRGWVNGGAVGTAVGAVAGLVIGCLVIVGCIWGAAVGAAIGAAIGIGQGDPKAGQAILDYAATP